MLKTLFVVCSLMTLSCASAEIAPITLEIPAIVAPHPAFTNEQLVEHVHLINPGAEVLIYVIDDANVFEWFNDLPPQYAGMILGTFQERTHGFPAPRITLLGHWSKEIEVAIHEYEHYIEYMVPDRRVELREAFHKLATIEFQIGAGDLVQHVEMNGKPNPVVMGFPTSDE